MWRTLQVLNQTNTLNFLRVRSISVLRPCELSIGDHVDLFADHEGDSWKIEQRQLQDRHQLARTQLKETFFLQRSQMLNRHQKVREFTQFCNSSFPLVNGVEQCFKGDLLFIAFSVKCYRNDIIRGPSHFHQPELWPPTNQSERTNVTNWSKQLTTNWHYPSLTAGNITAKMTNQLDSDDDFHLGCRKVSPSHRQQLFFSYSRQEYQTIQSTTVPGLKTVTVCMIFRNLLQEVEQHNRLTKLKEEEMKRRHEIERKRLPKIQREEIKSKTQQYRKSLRIDKRYSMDIERELMKEVPWSVIVKRLTSFQLFTDNVTWSYWNDGFLFTIGNEGKAVELVIFFLFPFFSLNCRNVKRLDQSMINCYSDKKWR